MEMSASSPSSSCWQKLIDDVRAASDPVRKHRLEVKHAFYHGLFHFHVSISAVRVNA